MMCVSSNIFVSWPVDEPSSCDGNREFGKLNRPEEAPAVFLPALCCGAGMKSIQMPKIVIAATMNLKTRPKIDALWVRGRWSSISSVLSYPDLSSMFAKTKILLAKRLAEDDARDS